MPLFPIDPDDRKEIGRTGEKVSAIGLGTWAIRDYSKAEEVLVYAVEHGLDLIDTAEMYGHGRAEELIGRVIRRVGKERVFVTTKMLPEHLVSRDHVLKAARASLKRLGIDTVDLFLIHWPNSSMSIAEQVRNFEVLWEEGLARYIGVSNFDRHELEEAIYATRKADIVVDQVHYSILNRGIEHNLLPYAMEVGVTIQAYTPLEKGAVIYNRHVCRIAERNGKTPVQVALNYLISRPRVVAIPKTESMEHLKEIMGALGWRLSFEDLEYLEENI